MLHINLQRDKRFKLGYGFQIIKCVNILCEIYLSCLLLSIDMAHTLTQKKNDILSDTVYMYLVKFMIIAGKNTILWKCYQSTTYRCRSKVIARCSEKKVTQSFKITRVKIHISGSFRNTREIEKKKRRFHSTVINVVVKEHGYRRS